MVGCAIALQHLKNINKKSMKTLYNTLKIFAGIFLLASFAMSCVPEQQSMGDAGQTLIKLTPAGFNLIAIDAKATPQKANGFILRKDAHNSTALNTPTTVVIKKDDAILTWYNAENSTNFVPLPTSLCTPSLAAAADGTITVEFAAGVTAAALDLTIPNASIFDFSKQYGLAYRIESVSGEGKISEVGLPDNDAVDTIVIQVLAKNKYDGLYLLKGKHSRDPYTFPYETEMEMHTNGASSVRFFWPEAGGYGHPIGVGPDNDLSWYGTGIGPVIVFDPVTNLVSDVFNAGSATPITKFTGAGANSNLYDPATKTIYVSWNYNNNPLRAFFDTLTYIGPR
jgi:hypothetical protein